MGVLGSSSRAGPSDLTSSHEAPPPEVAPPASGAEAGEQACSTRASGEVRIQPTALLSCSEMSPPPHTPEFPLLSLSSAAHSRCHLRSVSVEDLCWEFRVIRITNTPRDFVLAS